jgi:hypothetical protein
MAKPKTAAKEAEDVRPKRKRVQSDFPKDSLEQALRVAKALEEANGGQPLPPIETATALGVSPGSSDFRVILSSSLKYGLTNGSYKSDRIALDELGREIVEPKTAEERQSAIVRAAMRPPTFSSIYDYYKGKKLPEKTFFQNTVVREFDVPREHAEHCVAIFTTNMEYVGLIRTTKSGRWLSTEATPAEEIPPEDERVDEVPPDESSRGAAGDDNDGSSDRNSDSHSALRRPEGAERRVFITHGKDKTLVDPIKKLLGFGELVPVVSVERSSVSKPVPEKVMDDMRTCGAAIIHVDAEHKLIDKDAKEHSVINPNVLIEIGAAMALYGRRFILLVREGVKLPSNLQGLYEVRYDGEALDGDATIRLLEAINDIKKNPLPDGDGAA